MKAALLAPLLLAAAPAAAHVAAVAMARPGVVAPGLPSAFSPALSAPPSRTFVPDTSVLPRLTLATPTTPTPQPAMAALPTPAMAAGAPAVTAHAEPAAPFAAKTGPHELDQTAAFAAGFERVSAGNAGPLPAAAGKFRYLLARGFLWEDLPGYMVPNLERLRALGLDVELVDTDPAGSEETNGAMLAAAIAASDKPVILLGHSKGALDSLAALRDRPELQEKVAVLVALQSPYFGSPVADHVIWRTALDEAQKKYARLFDQAYRDEPLFLRKPLIQFSRRERAGLPDQPPELRAGLKLFSIVTSRARQRSDGVVSPEHGVIPGAVYASIGGADHVDTILGRKVQSAGGSRRDPAFAADLAEAIVRWIHAQ